MLAAAFAAGAFFASPLPEAVASTIANNVICNGCVGTSDLAANSVTTAKMKDGEVKTADIAIGAVAAGRIADGAVGTLKIADDSITAVDIKADAVEASEIAGVTKLIFVECSITDNAVIAAGVSKGYTCSAPGADLDDNAIASTGGLNNCFAPTRVDTGPNLVLVVLANVCAFSIALGPADISIIVYDT